MRLISRAEEAALVARAERAEAEAERLRTSNATLLDALLQRKPDQPVTPLPKRQRDPVLEAIGDVAGSNATLRKHLGVWSRQQRADKVPDDEIVHELLNWPDDDRGVPE